MSQIAKEVSKLTRDEWKEFFSGHWEFAGERQALHEAMFSEEFPRRLIRMFSFEVKARAGAGHVALTQNARGSSPNVLGRTSTSILVINVAGEYPDLYVVCNPAACLQPGEQHQMRYLVPLEAIVHAAEDAL